MNEYFNTEMIVYAIVFATLLISTTNNYISLLKYYVLQVALILVLFFSLYCWYFIHDKTLLISFIFAILIRLIIIPTYINHFIKKFYVKKLWMRITDRVFRIPQTVIFLVLIWFFILSYKLSLFIFWKLDLVFAVSFFVFLAWMLNFINHRKLVWDIMSFLEIENAVFLAWLLIIEKVPIYIEFGIIIDVLLILLILLILVYNIKKVSWNTFIWNMNELKD